MAPLLFVKHLTVSYHTNTGPIRAVQDATFQISAGETLALVGETGCGKSTVALSILGLIDQHVQTDSGQILFEGVNTLDSKDREWRRIRGGRIGMVFQDPRSSLNPVLTAGEHLMETLRAHQDLSREASRRLAQELLAEVGMPDPKLQMKRYPFELSGGMCQRLGIALGICNQPSLLIADEPTSALDLTLQAHILALLRDLMERHRLALLLISHDLPLVSEFADRVAVMYHGRLVEIGSVDEIFPKSSHPYTQALAECLPSFEYQRAESQLSSIPGFPPRPGEDIPGCVFAPRCALVEPQCSQALPPRVELSETHWATCIKAR